MKQQRQPILEGKLAEEANAVLSEIAEALTSATKRLSAQSRTWHGGAPAEFALFFGCLAAASGRENCKHQAAKLTELAVELFPSAAGLGLHGGLSGLAWTMQFLARPPVSLEIDPEDVCVQTDELLLAYLQELQDSKKWTDYDLISGFAGHGLYLLSRLPSKKAARALKLIIARLDKTAEEMPRGISWHTPARVLPDHQRKIAPQGYYNLGVAHGVPGVIGFLAEAFVHGIEQKRALALLEGAVRWTLSQKLPPNPLSLLPAWVAPGQHPEPCRVAWCYGELGAAVALLGAARKTGRADWEAEALALAQHAAQCPPSRSGVVDACLCHGAAGNGHLFLRLFRATGNNVFLAAARSWFAWALRLRGSGRKLAGYSFWTSQNNSPDPTWGPDASLLSGVSGVGLTLLGPTWPLQMEWDHPLLVPVR